jgi:hypothetical protein
VLVFRRRRREYDPYKLASPQVYLWRMTIFLIITAFIALILYQQVLTAFRSNPGLNSVIIAVLFIGIGLSFRQIFRLFPEIRWVNTFRVAEPGVEAERPPILLAPMATLLGDRIGRMAISTATMRSILDSIQMRLDEDRDMGRYLTSLLIFLGLLGTFWGLLQTVSSVANTIQSLDVSSSNTGVIFEDLKAGLAAPLQGMGVAFSSSLFGLAGSLILGFLDLQAGQGQNMFYNDLEDWLSTVTDLDPEMLEARGTGATTAEDLRVAIERLSRTIQDGKGGGAAVGVGETGGASTQRATTAMANLAEGIQGLVQHMRSEQQVVRSWVETQSEQQKEVHAVLDTIAKALQSPPKAAE